ncbi:hypothetical protein HA402_015194 [Bradysia odoriphaga]|nr:hypothetical protein HA402_015194 [Bradysia odoriphaga]
MKPIRNAIVFVGNTRVGKSYICNRILKYCNSSRRYVSTSSNMSVTSALQQEVINYQGKNYTIVDSPGFFDTSSYKGDNVDGVNMCKLVRVLESCEEIFAIIFVFTDGFSTPHKIWFDRMVQLVSAANRGHILLLRNKEGDTTPDELAENKAEINQILGGGVKQPYFGFEFKASDEIVKSLLNTVTQMVPFQLNNLLIPEICYEKTEESAEYEELISDPTSDEGYMVKEIKDTSHYETRKEAMDGLGGLFGLKLSVREWVNSQAVEEKWVEKKVTRRTTGTFVNVFQVRFDGTRDLIEKREIQSKRKVEEL